ncbi:MAG TPA: site-specific integrase [Acidobacteriota bacterium]|nr:site-specific integrase [Acidobacteriota bacterium]
MDSATEIKTVAGEESHRLRETEIKAAPHIENLLQQLENDGKKLSTINNYRKALKHLLREGADLFNPESTKAALAKTKLKPRTKKNYAAMLNCWFEFIGVTWKRPKYSGATEIPYIPTEILLDQLIAALGPKVATYCQLLKETGARCGEVSNLTWASIDFQQRIVRIKPEKGSNPRILPLKDKAIEMLNNLKAIERRNGPRADGHIFANADDMRSNFFIQRRRIARKLGSPEILQIHFHTFRRWKATVEYHEKPDILYVAEILSHKNIEVTRAYIQIEKALYGSGVNDKFIVKIATTAEEITGFLEIGFEYIMTKDDLAYFRKRK